MTNELLLDILKELKCISAYVQELQSRKSKDNLILERYAASIAENAKNG